MPIPLLAGHRLVIDEGRYYVAPGAGKVVGPIPSPCNMGDLLYGLCVIGDWAWAYNGTLCAVRTGFNPDFWQPIYDVAAYRNGHPMDLRPDPLPCPDDIESLDGAKWEYTGEYKPPKGNDCWLVSHPIARHKGWVLCDSSVAIRSDPRPIVRRRATPRQEMALVEDVWGMI